MKQDISSCSDTSFLYIQTITNSPRGILIIILAVFLSPHLDLCITEKRRIITSSLAPASVPFAIFMYRAQ